MKEKRFIKTDLFAHRGLHQPNKKIYENTISAFKAAIDHGFSIELDTNILKDGTVVVFHDANLSRLCGIDQNIKDLTFEEIKDLQILDSKDTIQTLEEVLKFINGRVSLMIELKPFGNHKLHAKKVSELLKQYPYPVAIQSFNPFIVYWFKKHDKTIIRGQISEFFRNDDLSTLSKSFLKRMPYNFITKPDFINYGFQDLPNAYCDRLHKKGVYILAYAVRSQKSLDFMKSRYDNAVFEGFIPKK